MLTRLKQLGAALAAVVLMTGSAQAATVIDFQTGSDVGVGGSITWDGTNLIGSEIPIGALTVFGAPSGNGAYDVSGTATASEPGSFGSLDFDTAANFITITGCVEELGIGTDSGQCQPVTLLSGTFTSWSVSQDGLLNAAGLNTTGGELLAAIGIDADIPWRFFGFSMTADDLQPNGEPVGVISTDIKSTPIPEPTTMMLLGTGLLAAFRARRRQQA